MLKEISYPSDLLGMCTHFHISNFYCLGAWCLQLEGSTDNVFFLKQFFTLIPCVSLGSPESTVVKQT